MEKLNMRLLGQPHVSVTNVNSAWSLDADVSQKALGLIYYLAVENRPISRIEIATLFWGELPEASARRNLRVELTKLRKKFSDYFIISRSTIELNKSLWECDTWKVEASTNKRDLSLMEANLTLYQGALLDGFILADTIEFDTWLATQREYFHQRHLETLSLLIQKYTELQPKRALPYARKLVQLDPWNEQAHQHIMHLLYMCGDRSAALNQFDYCQQILAEELGVEPTDKTIKLAEEIRQAEILPPLIQTSDRISQHFNVPIATTKFIGREQEVKTLIALLQQPQTRMVTLFGPGGIGKTRLALATAAEIQTNFLQGACFIPLENVSNDGSDDAIIKALGRGLNIKFHNEEAEKYQLFEKIGETELLLVIDNVEHLIDQTNFFVDFLANVPHVKIIVTSREILRLPCETVYQLEGLTLPPFVSIKNFERFGGIELFVNRARHVDLGFDLAGNEKAVLKICNLVGGLPLGIELAAGWVRVLSCEEIVQTIEESIDNLSSTMRNTLDRHQNLRAVFNYSWALLAEEEKEALMRLAVYSGGFTTQAAMAVSGATAQQLLMLVDKSLVQRGANGRFTLHLLIYHYACEKLHQNQALCQQTRAAHSHYYLNYLSDVRQQHNIGDIDTLERTTADIYNIKSAWEYACDHKVIADLLGSSQSMAYFYDMCAMHNEGLDSFTYASEKFKDVPDDPFLGQLHQAIYVSTALGKSNFLNHLGYAHEALSVVDECVPILYELGSDDGICFVHFHRARIYARLGLINLAKNENIESLRLATEQNDISAIARSTINLGTTLFEAGEFIEAGKHFHQAIEYFTSIADIRGKALSMIGLARCHMHLGDLESAIKIANLGLEENLPRHDNLRGFFFLVLAKVDLCKENAEGIKHWVGQIVTTQAEQYSPQLQFQLNIFQTVCSMHTKDKPRANQWAKQAMQLSNFSVNATHKNFAKIMYAYQLLAQDKREEADQLVIDVLAEATINLVMPIANEALMFRAYFFAKGGDTEKAEKFARMVVQAETAVYYTRQLANKLLMDLGKEPIPVKKQTLTFSEKTTVPIPAIR